MLFRTQTVGITKMFQQNRQKWASFMTHMAICLQKTRTSFAHKETEMVRSMIALASLMDASHAMAEDFTIKPKLIMSQMTLDAKDATDDKRTIPGKGAGLGLEYSLTDRTRVGAELSYTEFERSDVKSFDTALGGYAAFDLLKHDNFSLYGKGGLSLHQFSQEDFKATHLVNGDVGIGASVAVAENIDLGAEYQYSRTLIKKDLEAKDLDYRVKDLSQTRNDYSVFVAVKF